MRRLSLPPVLGLALLAAASSAASSAAQGAGGAQGANGALALWQVTVLDLESGELEPEMTLVIEDGEIVAVRPTATIRLGADVQRIDATGKFVIPGLWDAHAHLSYWGQDALGRLVAHGVTSIREMGGDPDEIEAWMAATRAGELTGPSFFWCGPFLEGPAGGDEYRWAVEGAEQAREAALALLDRGVDFLKIQPAIGREEVTAIITAAQERGSYLVGHVPRGLTAIEAAELGLRSIDHLSPYLRLSDEELQATIEVFVARGTVVSPVLYSMVAQVEARGEDPAANATVHRAYSVVRAFYEAGIPMLVGANFAYRDWPHGPGSALHGEMRVLAQAGIPALEVLRMATVGNAAFLGQSAATVDVRPGARADLVLLEANPLEDIANVARISGVVLRGRYLAASELANLLLESR